MTRRRAVFMDKDGTLIEDLPYNVDPERIRLAPTAARAVRRLGARGYGIVIITNQSGVARGYFGTADLQRVEEHLASTVAGLGSQLIGFHACTHLPTAYGASADGAAAASARADGVIGLDCTCRKPQAGLLQEAAAEHDLALERCWMVGDTWMDVLAGRAAGCRTLLVGPDSRRYHAWPTERWPDRAVATLDQAVSVILESEELTVAPVEASVEASA